MSSEFTIEGLTQKQMVLADIMWSLDGIHEVNAFIAALPNRERKECATIIELMMMAVIEQCYNDNELTEAKSVLDKIAKR